MVLTNCVDCVVAGETTLAQEQMKFKEYQRKMNNVRLVDIFVLYTDRQTAERDALSFRMFVQMYKSLLTTKYEGYQYYKRMNDFYFINLATLDAAVTSYYVNQATKKEKNSVNVDQ
jgi:hypothetical protein